MSCSTGEAGVWGSTVFLVRVGISPFLLVYSSLPKGQVLGLFHSSLTFFTGHGCAAYLHPEEESFGAGFELQHINSSSGALVHTFELAVIREDDEVLNLGHEEVKINRRQHAASPLKIRFRPLSLDLYYTQIFSPTSSTFPVVRSFQQKWIRESSVC